MAAITPALACKTVTYGVSEFRCAEWDRFLPSWIERVQPRRVADLGGGANPFLSPTFVRDHQVAYSVLDISATELAKAPSPYTKVQTDLASPQFTWTHRPVDLAFSHFVAEHMASGEQFHRNVFHMLAPGGYALHCFPTLYALPFLVNRAVPDRISDWLLGWVQPRNRYQFDKFPAYYSWCVGPSQRQFRRFQQLGYEVVEYRGLFGHFYYEHCGPLNRLQQRAASWLSRHPVAALTSYAFLVLRKPATAAAPTHPEALPVPVAVTA